MLPGDLQSPSDILSNPEPQPAASNKTANVVSIHIAGIVQSSSINDQAAADVASALRK
jgi:hypothetical protein